MKQFLKNFIANTSFRQSGLLTFGTLINSLLGLVFYILLARWLGIAEFGRFSYYLGVGLILAELADLGIGATIVKFGAKETFTAVFGLALVHRIAVLYIFLLAFFILARNIDPFLIYAPAVALAFHLANLAIQGLVARQKFAQQVVINVVGNLLRLLLIWVLGVTALLTVGSGLVVFCLGSAATGLVGFWLLRRDFSPRQFSWSKIKEIFPTAWRFSLPTAASFSLASLSAKLDIPILYLLTSPAVVGLYSSAQKLASVLPQIAAALDSVFAPKLSQKVATSFRDYLTIVILTSLGLVVAAVFAPWLVPVVFSGQYAAASGILTVLFLAAIPLFLAGPFAGKILYQWGRPKYHLAVAAVSFVASVTGYVVLVPLWGAVGAAVTVGLTNSVALLFYAFFAWSLSG